MAYLRQRLGKTPMEADFAHVLYQRTHGNPLFLTAVVDEIIDQQLIRKEADGRNIQEGIKASTTLIPEHLRKLITYQLACCSPEEQTLLEVASVAGTEFTAGFECDDNAIEAQYERLLQQRWFLQARGHAHGDGLLAAASR